MSDRTTIRFKASLSDVADKLTAEVSGVCRGYRFAKFSTAHPRAFHDFPGKLGADEVAYDVHEFVRLADTAHLVLTGYVFRVLGHFELYRGFEFPVSVGAKSEHGSAQRHGVFQGRPGNVLDDVRLTEPDQLGPYVVNVLRVFVVLNPLCPAIALTGR
jgi:hypothetical protein